MEDDKKTIQTLEKTGQKKESSEEKDIAENKSWALLSYLGALTLIPLLFKKDSEFVQFHAKQGLVILIGWALAYLPFGFVFAIAAIVLSVLGFISAYKGEKRKLPFIADLADKINL